MMPLLDAMMQAALAAVDPMRVLPAHLPPPPRGRTVVVGAGKASARMAQALEAHWAGPLSGVVVTRYGYGAPCTRIEIVEAAHPVPDAAGAAAAQRVLAALQGLTADDLVICLMSGGGSALLAMPPPGVSLDDKRALTRALLMSSAPIGAINTVRRHLSGIKGGRLALACHPARVHTLVLSDVPGDDPAVVASGPTLPDASTADDALALLARYQIAVPPAVVAALRDPALAAPRPGDARLAGHAAAIIATADTALAAAEAVARAAGYPVMNLGGALEGEAREVARVHAALAAQGAGRLVILSGGETTVTVRGSGRGGRNTEYLLALALALDGAPGVHALAIDTDGIDGSEDNAGAWIGPDSLARFDGDAQAALDNNDAYAVFAALGDLVVTGPTRTNVNDLRVVLVERAGLKTRPTTRPTV
ncbi:glycerate kinase [Massilia sp. TS11]|uniref:glycerate kinase type-2 family protein n=1 Tax=Massilia sp. TS11 TaxID=2908003 RepID=UPI001EDB48A8|nr:glycerate kinase [Massilia sp. TS11]MCG2586827.1 glycerate kinase [Massilia sp. TS11]